MNSLERDPVEQLAEEFVARYRRGERPPLSEYVQQHPHLAEQIRELFPALVVMEELGSLNGPAAAAETLGRMPAQLGEYRILREVGRGGMGVVYEAVQESLQRHVALKVLPYPGLVSPMHLERFQREARAAARLHHTNIVPVFGVGVDHGLHYYAMQFIHGQGLDQILREVERLRRRIPTDPTVPALATNSSTVESTHSALIKQTEVQYFRSTARIALQVAQGLAHAHQQGIVHRDIKPSNLLLDAQGTVWVTDFGLAKLEGSDQLTNTGDLVGTLRYMAPECLHGESDPRSDVYSLGVTLYEMLTLRPAFAETNRTRLLEQIARAEPARPRHVDAQIPRDLETIVLKAMTKEPASRYATAQALADDLQRFVNDQPIWARRARIVERGWRWCRRNPRLAGLTGVVLLLLAVIAVGSPILIYQLWQQRDEAHDNFVAAEQARQEKTERLWASLLAEAEAKRMTGMAGQRLQSVSALDRALALLPSLAPQQRDPLELRNHLIASLSLADLGIAREWDGYPTGSAGVAFDSALERYARSDARGAISVRRVADDQELFRLPGPGTGAWSLKFSPDGRYLAAGHQHNNRPETKHLQVWDCAARTPVLDAKNFACVGELDFSPDGRCFAVADQDNTGRAYVAVHDLTTRRVAQRLQVGHYPEYVAFHPDGAKLAVSQNDRDARKFRVAIIDLESDARLADLPQESEIRGLAWRKDGRLLAVANGPLIALWSTGTWDKGKPWAICRGHQNQVTDVAFSHNSGLLASKAHDGTLRLWHVATQRELVRTDSFYRGCSQLSFRRDDQILAFGCDGTKLRLWQVEPGRECRRLKAGNLTAWTGYGGDFSPDDSLVASAGIQGVGLWECATGKQVGFLSLTDCWSASFLPDGRHLIVSSKEGLYRWPIAAAWKEKFQSGPAEQIRAHGLGRSWLTKDGRFLAACTSADEAIVVDPQDPARPLARVHHDRLHFVALSPDGKHLATGPWYGSSVKVWHVASGKVCWEQAIDTSAAVTFSPDGRRLIVSTGNDYRFVDTTAWQETRVLSQQAEVAPGDASFSADGRVMVIRHSPTRLRLLNSESGEHLVEFQTPDATSFIRWHRLSPDARYLITTCTNGQMLLWNVRLLREQLATRGLDWHVE